METSPDALLPHGDGPAGSTETVLRAAREIGYGSVSAALLSDQLIYSAPLVSYPMLTRATDSRNDIQGLRAPV